MTESKAERKARKALEKSIKLKEKSEKDREKFLKNKNQTSTTILCVKFGNKYGTGYVERLRNMISRHTTLPYEMACLTDDQHPIEGVRSIVRPNQNYSKGWWHKVHMFDPSLPLKGRILYFDLDVVIHNSIDKLITYETDKFLGILDFNRKFYPQWNHLNSSVLSWNAGTQHHIWHKFQENPADAMRLPGDQDWIWKTSRTKITFWPKEWIMSYKWEIRSRQELQVINGKRNFQSVNNDVKPPKDCSVCVFHGDPNPEAVRDRFVVDNWR